MIILDEIQYYRLCSFTEWRMVKGNNRYAVSCDGEVLCWSWGRNGNPRLCRLSKHSDGYLRVCIDCVKKYVHRIVAEVFIPNPQNKPCIDHINTLKTDNRIENLRWVTYEENSNNPLTKKHLSESSAHNNNPILGKFGADNPTSISIVQLSLDGQFIKKWSCAREVERELGIDSSNITKCCRGKKKSAGGFRWVYASEFQNSSKNVIKTKRISDIRPLF